MWLTSFELNLYSILQSHNNSGPVAQWITRLPTEQKIAGSIPARIGLWFFSLLWPQPTFLDGIILFIFNWVFVSDESLEPFKNCQKTSIMFDKGKYKMFSVRAASYRHFTFKNPTPTKDKVQSFWRSVLVSFSSNMFGFSWCTFVVISSSIVAVVLSLQNAVREFIVTKIHFNLKN